MDPEPLEQSLVATPPIDSSPSADSSAPRLSSKHAELIKASAISDEVAAERGYQTVTKKSEVKRLGFSDTQCLVPALMIPVFGVHGEIVTYQIRPDTPRIVDGKPLKYETPKGSTMALDVPWRARPWLGDSKHPLFITEGARKADAGVTAGLCVISLLGVWNFRGTNDQGGTTALGDWESIHLKKREVYIVFDSDVMQKQQVALALARLKAFLESRGAKVRVVYLPPGEGATKVGLDDFFAAGGTVDQLLALAQSDLRPQPESDHVCCAYFERDGSTYWNKRVGDGFVEVRLANFTARISSERTLDDGVESHIEFGINAHVAGHAATGTIAARSFYSLNWIGELLGARAIVAPGVGAKDHMRAAIQHLSTKLDSRRAFTHTGWRKFDGHGWLYLSGNGPLGPNGPVPGIEVSLPEGLGRYSLPAPPRGDECTKVVRASIELLELAPPSISFPVFAAIYRAAMGDTDFALWLAGMSGVYKTEVANLAQSHYGATFTARDLPGNWSSTANSLERLAFSCKDALLTVDDFAPQGSRNDVQRYYREADRLIRAQGNRSGRGRLRADASPVASKPPRGMILSTGEDVPPGHSLQARMLVVDFSKGDVDQAKLTQAQAHAAAGDYASAMSAFICWSAGSYEELKAGLRTRANEARAQAQAEGRHARTASIAGELQAGFEHFLKFAEATGAIDAVEGARRRDQCWSALLEVADAQAQQHAASEPATVFIRLLSSALASGNAHIADTDGDAPSESLCAPLGWRSGWSGEGGRGQPIYRPLGSCVGWVDGKDIYLDPDAALQAAQEMGDDASRISISVRRLSKQLLDRGYLLSNDLEHKHVAVRQMLQGKRRRVLHLSLAHFAEVVQVVHSVHGGTDDAAAGRSGPVRVDQFAPDPDNGGPVNRSTVAAAATPPEIPGPDGPNGPVSGAPSASWGEV